MRSDEKPGPSTIVSLGEMALRALIDRGLRPFEPPFGQLWRFRISPDLFDDALHRVREFGGLNPMHDMENRLYGYPAVRDPKVELGHVYIEKLGGDAIEAIGRLVG